MKITEKLSARNADVRSNAPVLIACLGDSVTHGCFEVFINRFGQVDTSYDQEQGYVAALRRRLTAYYPTAAVSVLNAGISGDNAPGGLARLERDVLSRRPDLVTVNFGLNDSARGMEGLDDYKAAMDGIFDRLQEAGIECMLVTPNRMCAYTSHCLKETILREIADSLAEIQNGGVLDAYVQAAREIAVKRGIPIADAYKTWCAMEARGVDTTAMLCNHINHPSPEAHNIFVERIMEQIFTDE